MKEFDELTKSQLRFIEIAAQLEDKSLSQVLDKLIADPPIRIGLDFYKGYTFEQYACPSCHAPIGDEAMYFSYCPSCGKRILKDDK